MNLCWWLCLYAMFESIEVCIWSLIVWFGSFSHRMIGFFYLVFGIFNGVCGYLFSFLIRVELEISVCYLFSLDIAQLYNVYITVHGVLMIFLFIMPVLIGFVGNKELPEMLQLCDFALPRLNNVSFWLSFDGFLIVVCGFFIEESLGTGWTVYPPLADCVSHSSISLSLAILSLHCLGFSSEGGSINFIETSFVLCSFCSVVFGLLVWVIIVTSVLLIFSLPILACGITLLLFDREFGGVSYCALHGGDCVLFQHYFWYFGHPEVYIIILPAFGVVSYSISRVGRIVVFGYQGMLFAILSIGVIGFCVWAHHLFVVGLNVETRLYFSTATMIIAVPTSIKIFTWISSLLFVDVCASVVCLFIYAFLLLFLIGGFTGIVVANSCLDIVLHDSYYVVGHFHFVLSLGAVFAVFLYFSLNVFMLFGVVILEFLMNCLLIGLLVGAFNVFYPQHMLGLYSHPRRIFCYPELFGLVNSLINAGIIIILCSLFLLFEVILQFNLFITVAVHGSKLFYAISSLLTRSIMFCQFELCLMFSYLAFCPSSLH